MRVLCFGDSNTFGKPGDEDGPPRYPAADRWPCVMAAILGCELVEEGLPGRTTDAADPTLPAFSGAGMDGAAYLPAALGSHLPLDWVVILLGTNDCKTMFDRTPMRIAIGAARLVEIAQRSVGVGAEFDPPRVLLVCPPSLGAMTQFAEMFEGGTERAAALPPLYQAVARMARCAFFDAGTIIATDGADGLHWSAATQRRLGTALAEMLQSA